MKNISEKEIRSVAKLPADERYEYGMKLIAGGEEMWSLKNAKGWVREKDEDGVERFMLWPHPGFAQLCVEGEWKDAAPARISLDEWFRKFSEKLIQDETEIAFFPVPAGESHQVGSEQFLEDLEERMEGFE